MERIRWTPEETEQVLLQAVNLLKANPHHSTYAAVLHAQEQVLPPARQRTAGSLQVSLKPGDWLHAWMKLIVEREDARDEVATLREQGPSKEAAPVPALLTWQEIGDAIVNLLVHEVLRGMTGVTPHVAQAETAPGRDTQEPPSPVAREAPLVLCVGFPEHQLGFKQRFPQVTWVHAAAQVTRPAIAEGVALILLGRLAGATWRLAARKQKVPIRYAANQVEAEHEVRTWLSSHSG